MQVAQSRSICGVQPRHPRIQDSRRGAMFRVRFLSLTILALLVLPGTCMPAKKVKQRARAPMGPLGELGDTASLVSALFVGIFCNDLISFVSLYGLYGLFCFVLFWIFLCVPLWY